MKGILEYSLPEESLEFNRAANSSSAYLALWEIANEVFRPARKHGYENLDIPPIEEWTEREQLIVSKLEKLFYNILELNKVEIE